MKERFLKLRKRITRPSRKSAFKVGVIAIIIFISVFASDLFPGTQFALMIERSFGRFFNLTNAVDNLTILIIESIATLIFIWSLIQASNWFFLLFTDRGKEPTMGVSLANSAVKYLFYVIGVVMVLSTWGVDPTAIIAAAGLAGIAISFAAQSVIQDIISGVFILIDKPFVVGDIVYVSGFRGLVVKMGLRTTQFKDLGTNDIKIFNNTNVVDVVNTSVYVSTAVAEIGISYNHDIRDVEKIIAEHLPKMKLAIPDIIEGPIYLGIIGFGASSVDLKFIARCDESKKFTVQRLMNRELKILFDERKIEIPFPQVVVTEYKLSPTQQPIVSLTKQETAETIERVIEQGEKVKKTKRTEASSTKQKN
jgi:moderate conductance mechanosensitive channel